MTGAARRGWRPEARGQGSLCLTGGATGEGGCSSARGSGPDPRCPCGRGTWDPRRDDAGRADRGIPEGTSVRGDGPRRAGGCKAGCPREASGRWRRLTGVEASAGGNTGGASLRWRLPIGPGWWPDPEMDDAANPGVRGVCHFGGRARGSGAGRSAAGGVGAVVSGGCHLPAGAVVRRHGVRTFGRPRIASSRGAVRSGTAPGSDFFSERHGSDGRRMSYQRSLKGTLWYSDEDFPCCWCIWEIFSSSGARCGQHFVRLVSVGRSGPGAADTRPRS